MSSGTSSKLSFPKTLIGFGYDFDDGGELKKIDKSSGNITRVPFEFHVQDDADYNQEHYEALGEAITDYVYEILTKEEHLVKLEVPKASYPNSFIFVTPEYQEKDKLLVLIHGSGVVRAGQWARSIIINKDLNSGTQIPYIRKAKEEGYGVIVMNTNDNVRDGVKIEGSETPEEHATSVWRQCVLPSAARHVAIVAHSYGGIVTSHLAAEFEADFLSRVFAIAFTDSVHSHLKSHLTSKLYAHILKISRNWVSNPRPLDSPLESSTSLDDVTRVSAGTQKHELTSASALTSVISFLEAKLKARSNEVEL